MTLTRKRIVTFFVALALIFCGAAMMSTNYSYAATKPAKVSGFKVAKASSTKVKLTWNKAKNAKKYEVYRAPLSSEKYKKIKTTTSRSCTLSATKGHIYCYKVRGINGSKKGSFSTAKEFSLAPFTASKMAISKTGDTYTLTNKTGKTIYLYKSFKSISGKTQNNFNMAIDYISQGSNGVTVKEDQYQPGFKLAANAVMKFKLTGPRHFDVETMTDISPVLGDVDEVLFQVNSDYNALFWHDGTTSWKPSYFSAKDYRTDY